MTVVIGTSPIPWTQKPMAATTVKLAQIYFIRGTNVQETFTEQIFKLDAPYANKFQGKYARYLFVCSAGILRSATAATVASKMDINARSCGSKEYALIPLSANLIMWAEGIYFMNIENYYDALDTFGEDDKLYNKLVDRTRTHVWEFKDEYEYMQPELVTEITKLLY